MGQEYYSKNFISPFLSSIHLHFPTVQPTWSMNSWDVSNDGRSQNMVLSVNLFVSKNKCVNWSPGILWSFSGNSSNTSCPRGKLGCQDGTSTHCQLSLHCRSSAILFINTMISIQSFPSSPCSHCSCNTPLQQSQHCRHFQFEEGGGLRMPGKKFGII